MWKTKKDERSNKKKIEEKKRKKEREGKKENYYIQLFLSYIPFIMDVYPRVTREYLYSISFSIFLITKFLSNNCM